MGENRFDYGKVLMIFSRYLEKLLFHISDRRAGVSPKPYESLNLALHVGDDPKNVLQNRTILAQNLGFNLQNLIYMDQIHSNKVMVISDPSVNKIENCDALITNIKNIPLMVMVADCVPILIYDPLCNVIAVAHAGRNGTFLEISKETVKKMTEVFGSDPSDLKVLIGVSIGSCCYEVGEDIADITVESFGKKYVDLRENKFYLDLKELNKDQLMSMGVKEQNIEVSNICTACDPNYYSYRREGVTGRFAGVLMLR